MHMCTQAEGCRNKGVQRLFYFWQVGVRGIDVRMDDGLSDGHKQQEVLAPGLSHG